MLKDDAKREALKRWRALPKDQRSTDQQAAEFAMKLALSGDLSFKSSAEPYQVIKGWLLNDLSAP